MIETKRLRLRQWQERDRVPFAALNADPEVMEFFPYLLTRAQSDATIDRCQQQIAERGWSFWAVELRDNQEFIGMVGLDIPEPIFPFMPCIEIGWRLAKSYWNQGYATEAAQAGLKFGFKQLELAEILAYTAVLNQRSQALMRKLGMSQTYEFDHPKLTPDHCLRLHVLYQLKRQSFNF